MSIDGLHGKPNSTRLILYRNHYNEKGLLCWTEGIEERKKGKWIVDGEFIDCSVCRREKWSRIPYEDLVRRFRYCPKCGARMEGIDETD